MFNLDEAIAEWRRQMLAAGVKTPVPLEELECHLREEIDEEMRLGASATQAFAGSFYVVPAIRAFFIQKSGLMDWIFCAGLAAASILFYGRCLTWIQNSPGRKSFKS